MMPLKMRSQAKLILQRRDNLLYKLKGCELKAASAVQISVTRPHLDD
jgi:hypothetical protein